MRASPCPPSCRLPIHRCSPAAHRLPHAVPSGEPARCAQHPLRRAGVHCRRGDGVHALLGALPLLPLLPLLLLLLLLLLLPPPVLCSHRPASCWAALAAASVCCGLRQHAAACTPPCVSNHCCTTGCCAVAATACAGNGNMGPKRACQLNACIVEPSAAQMMQHLLQAVLHMASWPPIVLAKPATFRTPCAAADDGEPAAAGGRRGHAAQRHAAQGHLCQAAGGCRQGWQGTWGGILLFAWDEPCWLCWLSTSASWKVAQAVRLRMPMLRLGDLLPACQTKLPNTAPTLPAAALH